MQFSPRLAETECRDLLLTIYMARVKSSPILELR